MHNPKLSVASIKNCNAKVSIAANFSAPNKQSYIVVFFSQNSILYFAKSDEAFFKMDYFLSSGIMDVWSQFFWPYLGLGKTQKAWTTKKNPVVLKYNFQCFQTEH